jgi:hypothetical protein
MLVGCAKSPTSPPVAGDVLMSVAVGSSAGTPALRAEVINPQRSPIQHGTGCSYWAPGMHVHILDADGNRLYLWDIRLVPLCPDDVATLRPGGRIQGTATLDGTLFRETGEPVMMQPGTYTAVVDFGWWPVGSPAGDPHVREQRAEFRWPLPSP